MFAKWGTRCFQAAPRRPKDALKTPQDVPKTHPRRSKMPPRRPKMPPRDPQDAPRGAQDAPRHSKTSQDARRRPEDAPKPFQTSSFLPRDLDFARFFAHGIAFGQYLGTKNRWCCWNSKTYLEDFAVQTAILTFAFQASRPVASQVNRSALSGTSFASSRSRNAVRSFPKADKKRRRSGQEAVGNAREMPQDGPKIFQWRPKTPQDPPRRAKDALKTSPRRARTPPWRAKTDQDTPRTRQSRANSAQDTPQDAILVVCGSQDGIKSAHNFHVGAILCQNSLITEKSYFSNRILWIF